MATQDLLEQLSDQNIIRSVGPDSYHRGRSYARAGRVTGIAVDEADRTMVASVEGSGDMQYRTAVFLEPDLLGGTHRTLGRCTCPVGSNCKHAAALMIAARGQVRTNDNGNGNGNRDIGPRPGSGPSPGSWAPTAPRTPTPAPRWRCSSR